MEENITQFKIKPEKIYYKITNKDENHHGYQYKDGLNILEEKFQKQGSCVPGGFYFTTIEHISKYLNFGCYLREIQLSQESQVIQDPDGDKYRTDKIILGNKYKLSNVKTFEMLLERGMKIDENAFNILSWALKNNFLDIVKFFSKRCDNLACYYEDIYDEALLIALRKKDLKLAKFFTKQGGTITYETIIYEELFIHALIDNNLEMVKFLMKKFIFNKLVPFVLSVKSKYVSREMLNYLKKT